MVRSLLSKLDDVFTQVRFHHFVAGLPQSPVEVDLFGDWVAGEVAREPLFDPQGERVRG